MDASPTKRRVLGSLDANASPRPRMTGQELEGSFPLKTTSPVKRLAVFVSPSEPSPKRRLAAVEGASALGAKRVCLEGSGSQESVDQLGLSQSSSTRLRSLSPEPSSVFDTLAANKMDTSRDTIISEDDIIAPSAAVSALSASPMPRLAPPSRPPRLTRAEAKEKAEILRLRLGLASYKLRTGQTDVPLETLERKRAASQAARLRSRSNNINSAVASSADWSTSPSRLQTQATAALAGVHHQPTANMSPPQSTRRPLPGAPVRRSSGETTTSAPSSSDVEGESGRRRSSGEELSRLVGQTPTRLLRFEVEGDGGAASGLLSLARS